MTAIFCLDDKEGMLFGGRRQSRDSAVYSDILSLGATVRMNGYSAPLFGDCPVSVSEDFLHSAGKGDICFIENTDITPFADKLSRIIIYRWNRTYPSDTRFPLSLDGWKRVSSSDFSGSSHNKITKEVYTR